MVRSDRIAVIGISQGGDAALAAVRDHGTDALSKHRYAAAVAYYPFCGDGHFFAPTLVLIGERDELTPARHCQRMVAAQTGTSIKTRLVVYPGATHWFNKRRLAGKPDMFLDHRMEYDSTADQAALREIAAFLRQSFNP